MKNILLKTEVRPVIAALAAVIALSTAAPDAYSLEAVDPQGENSVNGGFGFQAGLSNSAPGGFKWFNEYNRGISDLVWLNVQINLSLGDNYTRNCWYDDHGNLHCNADHWAGNSLEFAVGPKLRFPITKFPIILDAKLDGFLDLLFFNSGYSGVATGFRGGVGVHYFFFDNLAVGTELMLNFGVALLGYAEFYSTLDFQVIGVEFRF